MTNASSGASRPARASGPSGPLSSDGGEDKEEEGPQAIASGDDGKLFLLDQLNGRILTFDPKTPNVAPQVLTLPPGVKPTDLVVKGSEIFIWDGKAHALQPLGAETAPTRGLTETRSAEPVDDATITAFAQVGSTEAQVQVPGESTPRRLEPQERSRAVRPSRRRAAAGWWSTSSLSDKGAAAVLDVRGRKRGRAFDQRSISRCMISSVRWRFSTSTRPGRMYVLAENIPTNIRDAAFVFVARFSPTGTLDGVYEVPLSSTTVSRRCIAVSPEGDVYFLKTLRNAVDIVGLGFRATPRASLIEFSRYRPNAAALAWVDTKGISMAVGPLTRDKIIQSALGYEGIQWTVTPPSYGSQTEICSGFNGRIRVPMYMIGKQNETVRGVPYCWGCQGSVRQFMDRIQHGTLAGNVCTKDGIRPDTAGVDCSSFVSATWGLSTHFTTAAIPAIAQQLSNPWDLKPGDALDKPGSHVVLFMGFTPNREAQVMEASPGACAGRVCRNVYPLSWLLSRGFIPVRYRALAAE